MGRGKHKNWSHSKKREAYKARRAKPDYPKGGYGVARPPYAPPKRNNKV